MTKFEFTIEGVTEVVEYDVRSVSIAKSWYAHRKGVAVKAITAKRVK